MADFSFAPYNFIPFPEVPVPKPYAKKEELPGHDESDKEFFSGRIGFNVKALSEIAVGGNRTTEGGRNVNDFCRDVSGRLVIPGSTMRGFIRSHAEILGFAYPEYITDETYLYRKLAGNCKTARKQYSLELGADREDDLRLPNGVKAGWIYKKGTSYYIQPVREFGETGTTFFQIHERDLRKADVLTTDQYMYNKPIRKFRLQDPKKLNDELTRYNDGLKRIKNEDYRPYRGGTVSFDYEGGWICNIGGENAEYEGVVLNSAWMHGKTHHYLVSAEAVGEAFEVPREQIAEFNADYEKNSRQKSFENEHEIELFKEFYELPGNMDKKLFFYKKDKEKKDRLVGFGPTPYFRIFYKQAVKAGIPMDNQKSGYDYVQGMFGFVNGQDAYKGRITFCDAVYTGSGKRLNNLPVLLMGPRGTAIQMYLDQKGKDSNTLNTYNTEKFKLRGYKIYWKRAAVKTSDNENTKIVTHLKTLPAKSVFRGEIQFDHLKKDELGLLLLSLRYTDTEEQHESFMIGGGKPYGFGHIEIRDVSLSLIDQTTRYTSVNVGWDTASERVSEFKSAYKDALSSRFDINFEEQESVKVYKAYAGIKDADAYLETSNTIYMPASRKRGDSKDIPVYADFHPLEEAMDILTRNAFRDSDAKGRVTSSGAVSGKSTAAHSASRIKGAVWIAGYPLSESQRRKIEREGIRVQECVRGWPDSALLKEYGKKYDTVLLPARNSPYIERQAKSLFSKVYSATKEGKFDDGWKVLKS